MSEAKQALFISYAREDSVAADRIAEALRSHGLEVWFDQNELRGGDAWDQKIRNQIRTCALLIPIVSANTQTRGEGYFRREWKLAAERTHDMAAGIPFLVPVVVDETAEGEALVPEEFMRVQWTRLPEGRTTPKFVEQVKRLLEAPRGAARAKGAAGATVPAERKESVSAPGQLAGPRRQFSPRVIGAAIVAVAVVGFFLWRRPIDPGAGAAGAANPPAAQPTRATPAEAATLPGLDSKTLAVLPFENLSAEANSAAFADGLHDEVLAAVGKVSALKLIGRTSVLQYADPKKRDLREIAAKLGVMHIVEGRVRTAGSRVRIAVELVEAQSSRRLWGETYETELTDVFSIQKSIAQEISTTLKVALTPGEREALGQQLTRNPEAYRLYLQGKALVRGIGLPTPTTLPRYEGAALLHEQAAAADPGFVSPHLELTQIYGMISWFGYFNPKAELQQRAAASGARVQQMAPGTAEANFAAAIVAYFCEYQWTKALEATRAAQAGLPNSTDPIRIEAFALRRLGRLPEARAALARAAALDPQDTSASESLVETLMLSRRYEEAVRTADELTRRGATSPTMLSLRAYAQLALDGDLPRFRATVRPMRANLISGFLPTMAWRSDMLARDYAAAENYFASTDGTLVGSGGVVNNPVAQFRALLAFAQRDPERARSEAIKARAYYESRTWLRRQQPVVAAELALNHALAGDPVRARAEMERSRELLRALPDEFVEANMRYLWILCYLVLGDRDGVFTEMRIGAGKMSPQDLIPSLVRIDPLFDSLRDDPRFEEVLKLAKSL